MPKKARELYAYEIKKFRQAGLYAVGGVAGLQLQVQHARSRSWILRIKVGGRRRDIGLGAYPDVSIKQARERARETRQQIWDGIDPVAVRKAAQDALRAAEAKQLTFDEAALKCWKKKAREFKSRKHVAQWKATLDMYASPVIGKLPVDQVELAHIVQVLEPIWTTKTETASRLRGRIEAVIAWATVSGYRAGDNPARWKGHLDAVLPKPGKVRKVKHHAALPWHELPVFMSELRKREGMGAKALEFAIITAARSGEVRLATWDEIDLKAKLWTVPSERMKAGLTHHVPLSEPAVKLLKALPRFQDSPHVFPAIKGGTLSDMSLSAVTRRMEVAAVPHGFRSSFKDWCRSSTTYPDEVSELALAHVSSDATRAAYARDELLPKRTRLMRDWGKYCGTVQRKAGVTPIRGQRG